MFCLFPVVGLLVYLCGLFACVVLCVCVLVLCWCLLGCSVWLLVFSLLVFVMMRLAWC